MQQSQTSNSPLAQALIRVGKEGIETGDDAVLDAYFADDFVFHGPAREVLARRTT